MTEDDAEKCHVAGYSCQLCRPQDALPPHLAMQTPEEREHALKPNSPPPSPEYPVYGGFYNTASYMLDGTMLSERGMQHLKSLTIEKDRVRRKRRLGPDMYNPLDPMGSSHDNSLEGDDDDDDDDKPIPSGAVLSQHKDGEIVRPLADGSAPEPPEGFTIVVKDNGLMVLRKKRYRDLKKVGIGGFLAKTRTPKTSNKKEIPEDDKKKRPAWRPKKNKILVQYPEYIQDSFFGKDFMVKCPDKVDDEEVLVMADNKRVVKQDEGTALALNRDALAALEEMKAKEEAEIKEKEQELADARAAAEAAANEAADKARLAKEELDALKSGDITDSKSFIKEDEKMDDEDLMLPTDLFGDDIFKNLMSGGDIDIDESALDEAEEVGEVENVSSGNAKNELEEGLRDMLGPDFDAKDMEDILKGIVDNEDKAKMSTDIKSEPTDELPSSVNDTLNQLSGQNFEPNYFPCSTSSAAIKEELISTSNQISTATTLVPSSAISNANLVSNGSIPSNPIQSAVNSTPLLKVEPGLSPHGLPTSMPQSNSSLSSDLEGRSGMTSSLAVSGMQGNPAGLSPDIQNPGGTVQSSIARPAMQQSMNSYIGSTGMASTVSMQSALGSRVIQSSSQQVGHQVNGLIIEYSILYVFQYFLTLIIFR